VTKPFEFEGARRRQIAEEAAADLADQVDALIVVPNDRVSAVLADDASLETAFVAVDDVLLHAVRGIIELITEPGVINLDFADVRSIMTDAGPALIGLGHGSGPDRAIEAARQAVESPLLEADIEGASRILFNVAAPANLRLAEVREAAHVIRQRADPDANIIFGASTLRSATDDVLITLIATGLGGHAQRRPSIAPVRQPLVVPPERAVAPASTPPTASESAPAAKRAARPIKPRSGVEAPAPIAAEAPATSAEPPMIADGSPLSQKADESPEGAPIPAEAPDPPAAAPSIAAFVDDDLDVPSFLRGHGRRASARERPERPA
jgi:cell division protein FtsZ